MRVIAGSAGSRPLKAPPEGVRPTMDRVKGAIFSSLGDMVPQAAVLDLFSGSGAMGIEALSRGAASSTCVDIDPRCAAIVRENLRRTGLSASVQTMDVFRFIDLYAENESYDVIFADPPYCKKPGDPDHASALLDSVKLAAALKPGGIFVLEKECGGQLTPGAFAHLKSKRYGGSEIHYLAKQ